MIFPRYHQLDSVRALVDDAQQVGTGTNYLVEHSAGSGKSNSIAWLAHRLASLYNEKDERVFDSVIVITDRIVLDQQLQNTIYQFEHKQGVVQKIDESSSQLAQALVAGVPIVVTTLQKFPFVTEKIGDLPAQKYAVIIDEAHSSQSGESATELKGVLAGVAIKEQAKAQAEEEGLPDDEEEILRRSLAFFPVDMTVAETADEPFLYGAPKWMQELAQTSEPAAMRLLLLWYVRIVVDHVWSIYEKNMAGSGIVALRRPEIWTKSLREIEDQVMTLNAVLKWQGEPGRALSNLAKELEALRDKPAHSPLEFNERARLLIRDTDWLFPLVVTVEKLPGGGFLLTSA